MVRWGNVERPIIPRAPHEAALEQLLKSDAPRCGRRNRFLFIPSGEHTAQR